MSIDPFDIDAAPLVEPESIVGGSYVAWRRSDLVVTDADYSVSYKLYPRAGGTVRTIVGMYDAINEHWEFMVSGSVSSQWASGWHRWDLLITRTSDSEALCVASGEVQVFASNEDRRTHAEIMVTKIESILSGRADSDVESYSIKSRSLTKMSVMELTKWRDYYREEIALTGGSTTADARPKKNTLRVRWVS